jgi:hypothetical protein
MKKSESESDSTWGFKSLWDLNKLPHVPGGLLSFDAGIPGNALLVFVMLLLIRLFSFAVSSFRSGLSNALYGFSSFLFVYRVLRWSIFCLFADVGMLFSTFCWHVEDSCLYSISYNHFNGSPNPKIWYGVPMADRKKFDALVAKNLFPDLLSKDPYLVAKKTTSFSPTLLRVCHITHAPLRN